MSRFLWLALIVLVCFLLGWYLFIRIPSPAPGSGRSQDAFCRDLLQKKSHREALSWVSESSEGNIRTIGEQTPKESLAIVKRLYEQGAKQVWAVDLEVYPNEGQSTNTLIVELPEQAELRKQLFHLEGRVAASEGFDPVSDNGQHYLFLYKFKLRFQF
jgi:hypothetical protein